MGVVAKTVTGARAKLLIGQADGSLKLAGIFGNVSYGVTYDLQPIYILGRYNVAELCYTAMDAVTVQATGFRVVGNGPYSGVSNVPKLQDLLNHNDFQLAIVDRQTGATIMSVTGVRVTSWNTTNSARNLQDLTVNFMGTTYSEEGAGNNPQPIPQEDTGATDFG